ncbi:dihydrofolate reductase-like domain-containing protein [Mycena pura]|uniref:2,5-diamino-6-ribosylamino-4(3H)-pyrimidinone 5'-phosphate reductase n=1 Tax=Mycena pura TaxID=153505 RepID=A0AAD6URX3_9AGAR|nr:dihydrofolate reductase-like domain-containing protein [Mycena pura]
MSEAPSYLTTLLAPYAAAPPPARPHVTLTFAQSLDGKIAGPGGAQLILSGAESMLMTHWLRTQHDAIIIGVGTAINDDPQLNTRHLPPALPGERRHVPRPVVLDRSLRLPPTCKLLKNFAAGTGRRPWVIAAAPADAGSRARYDLLTAAGAKVLLLPEGSSDANRTEPALALLRAQGVRTLMVEGGARVIASFFGAARCVDTILVTTAPRLVGPAGVGYSVPEGQVR